MTGRMLLCLLVTAGVIYKCRVALRYNSTPPAENPAILLPKLHPDSCGRYENRDKPTTMGWILYGMCTLSCVASVWLVPESRSPITRLLLPPPPAFLARKGTLDRDEIERLFRSWESAHQANQDTPDLPRVIHWEEEEGNHQSLPPSLPPQTPSKPSTPQNVVLIGGCIAYQGWRVWVTGVVQV